MKNENNVTFKFFDVVLFLLSSLVTVPSFISVSTLAQELGQFTFTRDLPEARKLEATPVEFCPISRDCDKFVIPNFAQMSLKILLNDAKCWSYSFYLFWVIKGKPSRGGGKITPLPPPDTPRLQLILYLHLLSVKQLVPSKGEIFFYLLQPNQVLMSLCSFLYCTKN